MSPNSGHDSSAVRPTWAATKPCPSPRPCPRPCASGAAPDAPRPAGGCCWPSTVLGAALSASKGCGGCASASTPQITTASEVAPSRVFAGPLTAAPVSRSEIVLERELHDPRLAGRQDLSEAGAIEARCRIVEVRLVQHIEDLPAELERLLRNPERPRDGQIVLELGRSDEGVRLQRAVGAGGRRGEGGRAQKVIDRLVAVDVVEDLH